MEKKVRIGDKILEILATAGVVGFAALCEGTRDSGWLKGRNSPESRVKRSLNALVQKDLVVKIKSSAGPKWELTPEGKKVYDKNNLDKIQISKPPVWDGKWRVITFDIPERQGRSSRDAFRRKLNELGFLMIQKSVFISHWPCEMEIKEIAGILGIESFINLFEGQFLYSNKDYRLY